MNELQTIAMTYRTRILDRKDLIFQAHPEFSSLIEAIAEHSHIGWMEGKKAKGFAYAPKRNDDPSSGPLTHPWLVPYSELPEEAKDSNRVNGIAVLDILKRKGVRFVSFKEDILRPLVELIHDAWSRQKLLQGYVWGPENKIDPETGVKYHRDLLPVKELWKDPNLRPDLEYDINTAYEVIVYLIINEGIFPVIPEEIFDDCEDFFDACEE